jgi:hypothetical protein
MSSTAGVADRRRRGPGVLHVGGRQRDRVVGAEDREPAVVEGVVLCAGAAAAGERVGGGVGIGPPGQRHGGAGGEGDVRQRDRGVGRAGPAVADLARGLHSGGPAMPCPEAERLENASFP